MKKKLATLMMVSLLAVNAIGFGTVGAEESAEGEVDYSGTITMICGQEATAAFDAVMAAYQEMHPDVNIEYVIWETITDLETMMTNFIATDTLPDMYCGQVSATEQQYAAEGYFLPIDDLGIEENLVDGDKSLIKWEDSLFAFPATMGYSVTFCNNDKLKELGLELSYDNYPKCMDEFLDLLEKCRQAGVEYPYVVAGADTSACTAWPFQYMYQVIYGENRNFYADILSGKTDWTDPAFVKMFEDYEKLREYMAPDSTAKTNDGQKADFISGEAIFYNQTAGTLSTIRPVAPDMDILMIPASFTEKPEDQSMIGAFDAGISITSGAENPELCKDFLKFLASKEGHTIYCNNSSSIPTIKGVEADTDPAFRVILEIASKDELPTVPILSREWIAGFKEILKTGCQNWFVGEDPETVVKTIADEHKRLMEANPEWVANFLENYEYE